MTATTGILLSGTVVVSAERGVLLLFVLLRDVEDLPMRDPIAAISIIATTAIMRYFLTFPFAFGRSTCFANLVAFSLILSAFGRSTSFANLAALSLILSTFGAVFFFSASAVRLTGTGQANQGGAFYAESSEGRME